RAGRARLDGNRPTSGAEGSRGSAPASLLIDEGDHAKAGAATIFGPQLAVFLVAALLVAPGAMREQPDQPERQEIGNDRIETGADGPRKIDHELAGVIELAADAPETGDEELAADGLGRAAPDLAQRILFVSMLLLVGAAEDPQPDDEQRHQRRREV